MVKGATVCFFFCNSIQSHFNKFCIDGCVYWCSYLTLKLNALSIDGNILRFYYKVIMMWIAANANDSFSAFFFFACGIMLVFVLQHKEVVNILTIAYKFNTNLALRFEKICCGEKRELFYSSGVKTNSNTCPLQLIMVIFLNLR